MTKLILIIILFLFTLTPHSQTKQERIDGIRDTMQMYHDSVNIIGEAWYYAGNKQAYLDGVKRWGKEYTRLMMILSQWETGNGYEGCVDDGHRLGEFYMHPNNPFYPDWCYGYRQCRMCDIYFFEERPKEKTDTTLKGYYFEVINSTTDSITCEWYVDGEWIDCVEYQTLHNQNKAIREANKVQGNLIISRGKCYQEVTDGYSYTKNDTTYTWKFSFDDSLRVEIEIPCPLRAEAVYYSDYEDWSLR